MSTQQASHASQLDRRERYQYVAGPSHKVCKIVVQAPIASVMSLNSVLLAAGAGRAGLGLSAV